MAGALAAGSLVDRVSAVPGLPLNASCRIDSLVVPTPTLVNLTNALAGRPLYAQPTVLLRSEDTLSIFPRPVASPYGRLAPTTCPVKLRQFPFPSAVHGDGTMQVQTVAQAQDPWLYAVLTALKELTGHALLVRARIHSGGRGFTPKMAHRLLDCGRSPRNTTPTVVMSVDSWGWLARRGPCAPRAHPDPPPSTPLTPQGGP